MKEYIEREAVLDLLEKTNPVDFGSMFSYEAHGDVNECLHKLCYDVEGVPAADVAPMRHGRWIRPHWRNSVSCADCSECGAEAHHAEYRGVQKYYKICPNCGAKMDGKETAHD